MKRQMLIVDDNDNLREALKHVFEDEYELQFAASGEEAIDSFNQSSPDVVLMDFQMPGLDGVQTMQLLREKTVPSQMIIMSAYDNRERALSAFKSGAFDFVPKPFDVFDLKNMVDQAATCADKIIDFQPSQAAMNQKEIELNEREMAQTIERTLQVACI